MTPFYSAQIVMSITLPDTNIAREKMVVESWKAIFPFGARPIFKGYVSFEEGRQHQFIYLYIYICILCIYDWNLSIGHVSSSPNLSCWTQFSIRPTSSRVISHTLPFILELIPVKNGAEAHNLWSFVGWHTY